MKRIFLTLALVSVALLLGTMWLGWSIADPASREAAVQTLVQRHLLAAVGGLLVALMVHALVLTYFMGTGRWLEETSAAYRLDEKWQRENQALKYRTIPVMVLSVTLLILAAAFGAAADPASPVEFAGWWGLSAASWHFLVAVAALGTHLLAAFYEYFALDRNGEIMREVMIEVNRRREERGLATAKV